MKPAARIYVFVCGETDYRALSFQKDGGNLPPCLVPPHTWTRVGDIPYEPGAIISIDMEPASATANLDARGYHIVRVTPIFSRREPSSGFEAGLTAKEWSASLFLTEALVCRGRSELA